MGANMEKEYPDFSVSSLGECVIPSPVTDVPFIKDEEHVLYHSHLERIREFLDAGKEPPRMELAGPRAKIFFEPSGLRCGIVTCGGICPGINDVIRSIVLSLKYHYGVEKVFGFRFGYEGLVPKFGHEPVELTTESVKGIHQIGGTILASSRGSQDIREMVDTLERMNIAILFAIGGDGTLRGSHAITEEVQRRGAKIAVIGIPKTIDNDISYIQETFGFETAVTETRTSLYSAHVEATGARNGVGLVKLMGRQSGFIAAYATLANSEVNFCLIPEVPFTLAGFLNALERRLAKKGHALVVVAEGAGQELMEETHCRDASGNVRLGDIGFFLRDKIREHFKKKGTEMNLKYIDPSYTIRSMPATARDSAFCLLLGQNAVHAAMTGRTGMIVSVWRGEFTHVPILAAVSRRKQVNTNGWLWCAVLSSTGQPAAM
jgi:6-phosphofructokinase 1